MTASRPDVKPSLERVRGPGDEVPRQDCTDLVNAGPAVYEGPVSGLFSHRKPPTVAYAMAPVLHAITEDGEMLFVAATSGMAVRPGSGSEIRSPSRRGVREPGGTGAG